jgi:3-oxoadipate enol-lactonase
MAFANAGNIKLCYKVRGGGQPIIAITGFASSQDSFFMLARTMSRYYRIVTFDNRGIGGSDKPPGPYSMSMMAGDTIGLMDFLGIEKAHLLGGSMGGMVAQHIAIDYPQRVDKLILFSTSADGQWLIDLAEEAVPGWNRSRPGLASTDLQKLMIIMASLSFNRPLNRLVFASLARLQVRLGALTGPAGQIEAMFTHNVLEQLHLIQAPTLILTGSQDRLINPKMSEVMASRIKGAKLVILEGGSHTVAGEMAGQFNKEVLDFLRLPS